MGDERRDVISVSGTQDLFFPAYGYGQTSAENIAYLFLGVIMFLPVSRFQFDDDKLRLFTRYGFNENTVIFLFKVDVVKVMEMHPGSFLPVVFIIVVPKRRAQIFSGN